MPGKRAVFWIDTLATDLSKILTMDKKGLVTESHLHAIQYYHTEVF